MYTKNMILAGLLIVLTTHTTWSMILPLTPVKKQAKIIGTIGMIGGVSLVSISLSNYLNYLAPSYQNIPTLIAKNFAHLDHLARIETTQQYACQSEPIRHNIYNYFQQLLYALKKTHLNSVMPFNKLNNEVIEHFVKEHERYVGFKHHTSTISELSDLLNTKVKTGLGNFSSEFF